jgi:hypothetical protein
MSSLGIGVQAEALMWSHRVSGLRVALDLLLTRLVGVVR